MRAAIAALLIAGCSPGEAVVATTPLDVKAVAPGPSAPVASSPKEKTVFTNRGAEVGDRLEETEDLAFSMHLEVRTAGPSQSSDLTEKQHMTKQVEVLAVDAGTPTKVRVTYRSATKEGKPKPIAGKTYVVEAHPGTPRIRDPKGAEPPPDEVTLVAKDFRSLGKPDPFRVGLPTTPISAGDRVDAMAQAIAEYMNRDQDTGMQASDVAITYRGRSGEEGLFDIAMTLNKSDASMRILVKLSGDMRVRVNGGQTTGMSLAGPLTIGSSPDPAAGVSIEGFGSMTLSMTATP